MGKFSRLGNDLYGGRRSFDFIGRRSLWYAVSIVLVGLALGIIFIKGLNFGIEFTGGTQYRIDELSASHSGQDAADELRDAIGEAGVGTAEPTVTTSGENSIIVQTEDLSQEEGEQVREIIHDLTGAA